MAIGATAESIVRAVVGEGLVTAAAGVLVGAVASLALGRVLANQLYGVAATDPATLVAISVVLLVVAVDHRPFGIRLLVARDTTMAASGRHVEPPVHT